MILSTPVFANSAAFGEDSTSAPDLTAASGTNRFVVWQDNTPGNFDIFIRRSTDDCATWKSAVNLITNSGDSNDPQIIVSGSNVYVAWTQQNSAGTTSDIYFRKSPDKLFPNYYYQLYGYCDVTVGT